MELLGTIATNQTRRQMTEELLTDFRIRQNLSNEGFNLGPFRIFMLGTIRIKVNARGETQVIFLPSIAKLESGEIENTIVERNQILVRIDLLGELLIEEELAAFLHDVILELGCLELGVDLLQTRTLLLNLTLLTESTISLSFRKTVDQIPCHHLIAELLGLLKELPCNFLGKLELKIHTPIGLLPDVTHPAIPHVLAEIRALVVITELGMNHTSHIVLCAGDRSHEETFEVIIFDGKVRLGIVLTRPIAKRATPETLAIVLEGQGIPLVDAIEFIVLGRILGAEIKEDIQKIDVNVVKAETDIDPIRITLCAFGIQVHHVGLDVLLLFGIQRALNATRRRRRTGTRLVPPCSRTSTSRKNRTPTRNSRIRNLANTAVELLGFFRHGRFLLVRTTQRETLHEIDGRLGNLLTFREFAILKTENLGDEIRKCVRIILARPLQSPRNGTIHNAFILNLLPGFRERKTRKVGIHRLDKFTTNSLFNKLVRLEIGNDHMDP